MYENGEGVFQPAQAGKYSQAPTYALPDATEHSSTLGRQEDIMLPPQAVQSPNADAIEIIENSNVMVGNGADRLLSIYYQNVRGLRTKIVQLRLLLSSCDYDVLIFTETWLRADIESSEISTDYTLFRCDRNERTSHHSRGGGVLIAVKNRLNCDSIEMTNYERLEQIVVCIWF